MGSCPEELYSLPASSFFLDPYFKGMECRYNTAQRYSKVVNPVRKTMKDQIKAWLDTVTHGQSLRMVPLFTVWSDESHRSSKVYP